MRETSGLILANSEGKILLQLRSNIPEIRFPDHWSAFGGHVEEGETPEDALKREIMEEISYKLKDFKFWKKFEFAEHNEYFFIENNKDIKLSDLNLKEGADLGFFNEEEIKNLKCVPFLIPVLQDYFKEFR